MPQGHGGATDPVAPIVARLTGTPERIVLVEAFARAVLRRVPSPMLVGADPGETAAALAEAFEFVDRRAPGEIRVRLHDPPIALDGARPPGSVLEVNCEDRQFIVTTVREELHRLGQPVARILHPVFGSERDGDGRVAAILPARTAARRESFLQVELGGRVASPARNRVVDAIGRVLEDVFAATDDHVAMRQALQELATRLRARAGLRYATDEVGEVVELVEWLLEGNFVLLGCCRFVRGQPPGQVVDALGILGRPGAPLREPPPDLDAQELLQVAASAEVSTVHRQVPILRIDVAEVRSDGDVDGTFRIAGVFSNRANAVPAVVTPVLRLKLRRILELEDVVEGSHDEATLISLFQVLPKEELFEADVPALRQLLVDLLAAEEQQDVRALMRVEPGSRTVWALLSVPQELYSPALRQRLERFLATQLDGTRVDTQVSLGDRAEAILRFVVHVDALPEEPLSSLEREVRLLSRTWDQRLAAALGARVGEGRAAQLAQAFAEWFPAAYRERVSPEQAVDDVLQLDRLVAGGGTGESILVALTPDLSGRAQARLKVLSTRAAVELSRFLPIVESLGLWAVEELPYALGPGKAGVYLHDFGVGDSAGGTLQLDIDGPRLAEAASALWRGRGEVDSLNRLVLRAGLSWEDVFVLRAYHRFRNQVGPVFTTAYVAQVLAENGAVVRALLDYFGARFDPSVGAGPEAVAELRQRVVDGCDAVARLDHDRILRGLLDLVDATVRTNRYIRTGDHLALKFDSAAVPGVPRPAPYRELFVYGPSVEGVHLRWGPVARGGIRWSERPDDYRRETLGLMRTQVMKNALIVPTGAKGGFVVKRPRYGQGVTVGVQEAYEVFITCLLELTDNVVGGRVVPVPGRRDGDDPYLVVAADRGTAAFSDLANRLSLERGFWLGDAFASGGSHGYSHKRLGITARGAWVAVLQHFAELGVDMESEAITVVGIGDMSGDVFGNAMLRSEQIRLVAAFDHRDVFLDPNPDPALSYKERARLFALPGSSWQDYDRTLLSPGGGVWSRLDKRIDLSPEARAVLGVEVDHLVPNELIRAILQAPVDLLFAGGIGTFVRAATEPDHSIDDRANTDVRVEASRLRARVVSEGANLAFTQRARIEYARRGGRINTDAIDNSGGVDISDREVNLKILLRPAVEAGELTLHERDRLLVDVCDDVVAAVLEDSAQQSLALARAETASSVLHDAIEALIVDLATTGILDRTAEALPTTEELLRGAAGAWAVVLTRPELAVLLAGAKRSLTARLLASGLPDQPALRSELVAYFPLPLAQRFDRLLDGHRLRRELVASRVANDVVNRMGPTFVTRLTAETGRDAPAVVAAYWIARDVVDAGRYWRSLDDLSGPGATAAAAAVSGLLEAVTRAYLRRGESDIAAVVARDRSAFAELESAIGDTSWTRLSELSIAPDVADVARVSKRSVTSVAVAFLRVGEAVGVDRLVDRLRTAAVADRWSRVAWQGLVDDLEDLRRRGAERALADHPAADVVAAVTRLLAARSASVTDARALVDEVLREPSLRLEAVVVATRAVRRALS